ncbi:MAG: asparagine synthase C-terminal domain-containing protein, partial [bacterium]|nr:asparagine synthase C-terminal domain-containing protein [bacterium]
KFNADAALARKMASLLDTNHREITVYADDAARETPAIIKMLDDPLSNPTIVPTYLLCRLASGYVKSCLSGDGGDELFGGYNRYLYDLRVEIAGKNILLKNIVKNILFLKSREEARKFMSKIGVMGKPLARYYLWVAALRGDIRKKMLSDALREDNFTGADSVMEKYIGCPASSDFRDKMMYADIKTWLPDESLNRIDRMSMANSLEVRVPFLDHRLVEFASGIDVKYKVGLFATKYILKKALNGILPGEILSRRKAGFITPASMWLRTTLKNSLLATINDGSEFPQDIFNRDFIKEIAEKHISGKGYFLKELWAYYTFMMWRREYMK